MSKVRRDFSIMARFGFGIEVDSDVEGDEAALAEALAQRPEVVLHGIKQAVFDLIAKDLEGPAAKDVRIAVSGTVIP